MFGRIKNAVSKGALQFIGELILVAAGVYLGTIASNWNEQRNERIQQKDFLQKLSKELESNQKKLQSALAYREHILKTSNGLFQKLGKDTLQAPFWSKGGFQLIPGWKGVVIPTLENSVYQSGLISNTLRGLEFDDIHAIAQIYNNQEEYKLWTRTLIFDRITTIDGKTTTWEALSLLNAWSDIVTLEKSMIKKYPEAQKQLQIESPH